MSTSYGLLDFKGNPGLTKERTAELLHVLEGTFESLNFSKSQIKESEAVYLAVKFLFVLLNFLGCV